MSFPRIEALTIHCTFSENGREANVDDAMRLGCHQLIQPDGSSYNIRPLNEKGAHTEGHVFGNIGVALAGTDRFSLASLYALRRFITTLQRAYSLPLDRIYGHSELSFPSLPHHSSCPNIRAADIIIFHLTGDETSIEKYVLS